MAKVKHLTVSLENQPGRMAAVAKVLADAKVNIVAVLGSTAGEHGSVQVVVDNITKAKKALSSAQFAYAVGTLEQAELSNKPGALAEYAAKLAKKGINIDAAYGTVLKGSKKAVLFFSTPRELGATATLLLTNDGVLQSEIDRRHLNAGSGEG
jgi:hypothetical protein